MASLKELYERYGKPLASKISVVSKKPNQVFTNRVSPELKARAQANYESPIKAGVKEFGSNIISPLRNTKIQSGLDRIQSNVKELPRGIVTAAAAPALIKQQNRLEAQNDIQRNALMKQFYATRDKKYLQAAAGLNNTRNKLTELNPNVTQADYAKRMGGTFFDVATLPLGGAEVVGGIKAGLKVGGKGLIKQAAKTAITRGTEGAAYSGVRAASQGENAKTIASNAAMGAAFSGLLGAGEVAVPAVVRGVSNETRRVLTPDFIGRLFASFGFAKVPSAPEDKLLKNRKLATDNYRSIGFSRTGDVQPKNAGLAEIERQFNTPEGKQLAQAELSDALKKNNIKTNPDGTITVFRAGGVADQNNLASVSLSKEAAAQFGTPVEYRVRPEDVALAKGVDPGELIVSKKGLVSPSKTSTEIKNTQKLLVEPQATREDVARNLQTKLSNIETRLYGSPTNVKGGTKGAGEVAVPAVVRGVSNETRRVLTPDSTGRLPASPGFAKVPGIGSPQSINLKQSEIPGLPPRDYGQVKVKDLSPTEKSVKVKVKNLGDVSPESIKDISALDASFKSVYRNFEKAFGNRFQDVKRRILNPFDASKGNMVREQEVLAGKLKNEVVDKLGIGKGTKESALVQQFGEGKITLEELKKATPKWQNIVEADKWFRTEYDKLLNEVNAVRQQIYPNNPDKIIPKRKDYYRHFQDLTGMEGIKNIFDSPSGIPTELAGISAGTKPRSKFLSFAQKRLGVKTEEDAVGGFIDYMRAASYAKNIDPHIDKFRKLADELVDIANSSDDPQKASRLVEYISDFANDLSGKTNEGDRFVQKVIGRKGMAVVNWLNSRIKANVILGNLSSSVAQLGNTPQMMAKAGYKNWALGFSDVLNPKNTAINSSDFIKERYAGSMFDQFDTKLLDQPKKLAVWITQSTDELATKIGWNGFYRQAVERGVSNPVKYADDLTREMVGGRGIGEVPLIQKSKVTQLIAPFQLEVQNLMHVLGKEVSNKEIGVLLKYVIAAYGFNKAAEVVRGNGVTFDPIQATIDAVNAYREEDNKKVGTLRAAGRIAGEVLSNTMGGQQLASIYPENGIKIGGETVTRKELFGDKDPTRFGSGLISSAAQNPLYKIAPPFGGSQIEKTVEGVSSYNKGYTENKGGNVQYMVDKNPINLLKSAAFGKYSTSNAREYFDKKRTALSENQTAVVKAGGGTDYYNKVMADREANKSSDKLISLIKGGKNNNDVKSSSLGGGLYKVGDKVYSKDLDKTFDTEAEADLAVTKNDFKNSGESFMEYGDKILRKSESGDVTVQTRTDFTIDLNTAEMSLYKSKNDLASWNKAANSKLIMLYQKLNSDNIDALDSLKIQNQIQDLYEDIQKYKSYGGFKKGKSVSVSAPTIKKLKFSGTVSKPSITRTKRTTIKKPTVRKPADLSAGTR